MLQQAASVIVVVSERDRVLYQRLVPGLPFEQDGLRILLSSAEQPTIAADWLVVRTIVARPLVTTVPRSRRVFVTSEPSPMHGYRPEYLNQFGVLVSPYAVKGFKGEWVNTHQGLPWFFGVSMVGRSRQSRLTWQELVDLPVPIKQPRVSVVVSSKRFHSGHRLRLRFLDQLKHELGDDLEIYGHGIREVADKAEAILPFGCHLAIENTIEPGYWSEKLADALLGYALPIYAGCPDIDRRLPDGCLVRIDLGRPKEAAAIIRDCLVQRLWEERAEAIGQARQQLMDHETFFHLIARVLQNRDDQTPALSIPESILPPPRRGIIERIGRELRRTYFRFAR